MEIIISNRSNRGASARSSTTTCASFSELRVLLAPVEPETHAPSDHREGLLDVRVDVLAGHRAAGLT
jgi:hypothetical protein